MLYINIIFYILNAKAKQFRIIDFLFKTSCVKFFERFKLLNEGLVLIFQHCHSVLQTLDVLLLLPTALSGRLPVLQQSDLPLPVTGQGRHEGS